MRARSNDDAMVPFVWHGTTGLTFPVSTRPENIIRGGLVGVFSTFGWGLIWSVPFAVVQPGPIGTLITAFVAVVFGALTGVAAGVVLARFDTSERPFRHNLRTLRTELLTPRPQRVREEYADTAHLWHSPGEVEATPYPTQE